MICQFITGESPVWSDAPPRLFITGSIAHMAQSGDTLWGTGVMSPDLPLNGKPKLAAVRGPLTESRMVASGCEPCGVYGDPVLLLPRFYPKKVNPAGPIIIPHYADRDLLDHEFVDPFSPWQEIIDAIVGAEIVYSSSLHGIVAAEAYGTPAVWVEFSDRVAGSGFKFCDYYLGTDREPPEPLDWRERIVFAEPDWTPPRINDELLLSFPLG